MPTKQWYTYICAGMSWGGAESWHQKSLKRKKKEKEKIKRNHSNCP
jgi:hypothetical protein